MPVKMEIYVSEQCIYFVAADWIVIADYLHTFIEMVTQKWIAKCFFCCMQKNNSRKLANRTKLQILLLQQKI